MDRPITEKQSKYIDYICKVMEIDNPELKTCSAARFWISSMMDDYQQTLWELNAWMDAVYESMNFGDQ